MLIAELTFETGSLAGAGYMILMALCVGCFRLGGYITKVDTIAKQQEADRVKIESDRKADKEAAEIERKEIKADLIRIFEKLELLSRAVPHTCVQVERIVHLEGDMRQAHDTLSEHRERMDRIQDSIRDKEQARA